MQYLLMLTLRASGTNIYPRKSVTFSTSSSARVRLCFTINRRFSSSSTNTCGLLRYFDTRSTVIPFIMPSSSIAHPSSTATVMQLARFSDTGTSCRMVAVGRHFIQIKDVKPSVFFRLGPGPLATVEIQTNLRKGIKVHKQPISYHKHRVVTQSKPQQQCSAPIRETFPSLPSTLNTSTMPGMMPTCS